MSRGERKAMITRDAPELSLSRQCRLLSIGRSWFYYAPRGESPSSLALMRRIDELFMKYPILRQPPDGPPDAAGRRLRRPSPGSQVDAIDRPGGDLSGAENQRAASHAPDLSLSSQRDGYRPAQSGLVRRHHLIPVQSAGFLYLVAIMDWRSRHVILAAVEHHGRWILRRRPWATLMARYGQPEIGSIRIRAASSPASTSPACSRYASIRICHGPRGRCMDNIFIERLWRSLKLRRSTYTRPTASTPNGSSASGSASTTPSGPIRPSTVKRRPRPTGPVNLWI